MLRQAIVNFCCWAQHFQSNNPKRPFSIGWEHITRTPGTLNMKHDYYQSILHRHLDLDFHSLTFIFPIFWGIIWRPHFPGDTFGKYPISVGKVPWFFFASPLPSVPEKGEPDGRWLVGGWWLMFVWWDKIRGWMMVDTTAYYRTTPNPTTNRIE